MNEIRIDGVFGETRTLLTPSGFVPGFFPDHEPAYVKDWRQHARDEFLPSHRLVRRNLRKKLAPVFAEQHAERWTGSFVAHASASRTL